MNKFSIYMIVSMLLWAGGWSALKILTAEVEMEVVTFWRFFIMLVVFIPLLKFLKLPIYFKISPKAFLYVGIASLLNIAFMLSAYLALYYGKAGSGGVIISTLSPLITYALMTLINRNYSLKVNEKVGLSLGFFSGLVMLGFFSDTSLQFLNVSSFFYFLAALIWALLTVVTQKSQLHLHPIHYSYMIAVIATTVLFFILLGEGKLGNIALVFEQNSQFWMALLYLGVLAQTVATTIFFIASQKLGSKKASSFMFLLPPFALIISYFLLGEVADIYVVFGGFLSVVAVAVIHQYKILRAKS